VALPWLPTSTAARRLTCDRHRLRAPGPPWPLVALPLQTGRNCSHDLYHRRMVRDRAGQDRIRPWRRYSSTVSFGSPLRPGRDAPSRGAPTPRNGAYLGWLWYAINPDPVASRPPANDASLSRGAAYSHSVRGVSSTPRSAATWPMFCPAGRSTSRRQYQLTQRSAPVRPAGRSTRRWLWRLQPCPPRSPPDFVDHPAPVRATLVEACDFITDNRAPQPSWVPGRNCASPAAARSGSSPSWASSTSPAGRARLLSSSRTWPGRDRAVTVSR